MDNQNFKSFVGMSINQAKAQLQSNPNRIKFRISSVDGVPSILTRDYNPNRLNFDVEKGIIKSQRRG